MRKTKNPKMTYEELKKWVEGLTDEEHDDLINQGLNECNRCGKWQDAEKEMYWQGEEEVETNEIISPYIAVCDDCYITLKASKKANKELSEEKK